jgi:hypothetical protein
MKYLQRLWDALVSYSEELHEFRTRYYGTRPFDRYI